MLVFRKWYRGMTVWRTCYSSSHKPPQSWSQLHHYQSLGSLGATSPLPVLESWSHFTPRILESLEPLRFSQSLGATSQSLGSLGATSPLSRVSESWDFTTPSYGVLELLHHPLSHCSIWRLAPLGSLWRKSCHHSEVFEEVCHHTTSKSMKSWHHTSLKSATIPSWESLKFWSLAATPRIDNFYKRSFLGPPNFHWSYWLLPVILGLKTQIVFLYFWNWPNLRLS